MDFPKFKGIDPRGWVLKANQYFDFNSMEDHRKSKYASTYFEGRASHWYQFYNSGREWIPWALFTNDVINRFTATQYQDPQAEFNKLKQVRTVEFYLEAFEELRAYVAAMNPNLEEEYFIFSFISGLKEDIKGEVRMARLSSFTKTVPLAKQAEANHAKSRTTQPFFKQQTSQPNTFNQPKPNTFNYTKTPFPNPANRNPNPSQTVSRQRTLTSNEIMERRRKGICFHCDEKYGNGHVCKMKLYMLS